MDGAPRVCGRAVFERGFAAWVDFLEQVEGVCAGVETPAYQPAAGYNMALLPETQRERFDVVLVKPRNPLNIGAAARAMANFGFSRLSVVAPFAPTWREARSAVDSQDVLLNAVESATLGEAVSGATLVVGTGSLNYRKPEQRVVPLPELAPLVNQELARGGRVALVFGPEKHGLTRDDLSWCHLLVEIPTDPGQPSMNLGQAVAVCLYELAARSPVADSTGAAGKMDRDSSRFPSGAKARVDFGAFTARLKSCPDTELPVRSQVKSCPDTELADTELAALVDSTGVMSGPEPVESGRLELLAGVVEEAMEAAGYRPRAMQPANRRDLRLLLRRLALSAHDTRRILGIFRRILWRLRHGAGN
jgi:tRNA/rRNA methyltransferase